MTMTQKEFRAKRLKDKTGEANIEKMEKALTKNLNLVQMKMILMIIIYI